MKTAYAVILLLASCLSAPVGAVGLGELQVRSTLAQPFDARLPVTGVPAGDLDSLSARLAGAASFSNAGIDLRPYLLTLKFEVVTPEKGQPYIHIYSRTPLKEPSLDFLVEVQSASTILVRHCVALFDPPKSP